MATDLPEDITDAAAGDPESCIDRLLDILREGGYRGLLDEFKRAPLATMACIIVIVAELIHRKDDHNDDETPVYGDDMFATKCVDLAEALGYNTVTASPEAAFKGVILDLLVQKLLSELVRLITDWLDEAST